MCTHLVLPDFVAAHIACLLNHAMWAAQTPAPGELKVSRGNQTTILCKLTWQVLCPYEIVIRII